MVKRISHASGSKDVDAYIAKCPKNIQRSLKEIRAAVLEAAPGAIETTSYFQMPGFFYPGYDYNGMFVWFGFAKSYIRLLLRPPHPRPRKGTRWIYYNEGSRTSSVRQESPKILVKKLVKASVRIMKARKDAPLRARA